MENIKGLLNVLYKIEKNIELISNALQTDTIEIFDNEIEEIERIICNIVDADYEELADDFFDFSKGKIAMDVLLKKLYEKER
jgi:hypothetical protein